MAEKNEEIILKKAQKAWKQYSIFFEPIDSEIIGFCLKEDKNIMELMDHLNLSRVNVWKHINKLMKLKIVIKKKKGTKVYVSLTKHGKLLRMIWIEFLQGWLNYLDKKEKELGI